MGMDDAVEAILAIARATCQWLGDRAAMERAVTAWGDRRIATISTIDRHATTADARTKPRLLYPAFDA